jgi:hypothetical protein
MNIEKIDLCRFYAIYNLCYAFNTAIANTAFN